MGATPAAAAAAGDGDGASGFCLGWNNPPRVKERDSIMIKDDDDDNVGRYHSLITFDCLCLCVAPFFLCTGQIIKDGFTEA